MCKIDNLEMDYTIGVTEAFSPTHIIAEGKISGTLYQLWACYHTGKRRWKKIPEINEAIKEYGGEIPDD